MSDTGLIKIRTALLLNHEIDVTPNGFTPEFIDKLYEYEEIFREKIIIPINDAIGLHNWSVRFVQTGLTNPEFFADIKAVDYDDFNKICSIIKSRITDIQFECYYKGESSI